MGNFSNERNHFRKKLGSKEEMGSCGVEICWQLGIGGITVGRLVDRKKRKG